MDRLVREVLTERAARTFVGRAQELAVLLQTLEEDGAFVVAIHGIAGVGKSALLEAFTAQARGRGAVVARLDCREIEPTGPGFLTGLRRAIGGRPATVSEAARRLGRLGERVILAVDTYEVFRLADSWFRQVFVPALLDNTRVVFAGREAPVAAWAASPGWDRVFRSIPLGPLPEPDALELLTQSGMSRGEAVRINRFARGLPLALRVAAVATGERESLALEGAAVQRIVEELTRLFLSDLDPPTRHALDAGSVVRRITVSLLGAMLPDRAPQDSFDRLRTLPFVEAARDGLFLHDALRESIATALKAADPPAYRRYRQLAWRQLRREVRDVGLQDLWRYTADILYLIENPVVREAFFPTTAHVHTVDRARPEDGPAILEIARRHEPPTGARLLELWWEHQPEAFHTVRDPTGAVAGFHVIASLDALDVRLLDDDPLLRVCRQHIQEHPVPKGQAVLIYRRFLGSDAGESPSLVQAVCWLDLKRLYMEMRPHLRRIYTFVVNPAPYWPVLVRLGFEAFPLPVTIDSTPYHGAFLDFGPASVDGWLARVAGAELGVEEEDFLDTSNRELILDGRRIQLTRLEFELLQYLYVKAGKAVSRAELLEHVWGYEYQGGSNVVEAVVRTLRKKLGGRAEMMESVRGIGYRLRQP